jgi:hypothetical protein
VLLTGSAIELERRHPQAERHNFEATLLKSREHFGSIAAR